MESDVAQLAVHEQLWVWYLAHKKQAHAGVGVVLAVALIISVYFYQKTARETNSAEALTAEIMKAEMQGHEATAESLLTVAASHPDTTASHRAVLMAAGRLFISGQYPQSQSLFEKYLRDEPHGPMEEQAMMGVASCMEAQGKVADAQNAYQRLASRPPDMTVLNAKCALGRLDESQGKLEQARDLYDEVGRNGGGTSVGNEAGIRYHELLRAHPNLAPGAAAGSPGSAAPAFEKPAQ